MMILTSLSKATTIRRRESRRRLSSVASFATIGALVLPHHHSGFATAIINPQDPFADLGDCGLGKDIDEVTGSLFFDITLMVFLAASFRMC